ncbi:MAG: glycosyltransferase family 4 protein [Steroidobacteraceae bacterium]
MDRPVTESAARTDSLRKRDGTRPFVVIDGFNLSLEKGTGVATYARNLSSSLRDLDCDVGVLYGGPFSAGRSALLREVLFFDSQFSAMSRLQLAWRSLRSSLTPSWNRAFEVPVTGAVVSAALASRMPHCDSVWNARDLYLKSAAQFSHFGVINRVSMPRKPEVCHWTYPLPLKLRGVPNIYTLHDLVPLRLPYTTLDRKERHLRLLKWICRTAAHIVTVSEHSKRDIVELLGVDPAKVTNTYQAVSIPDEYRLKPEDQVQREVESIFGLNFREYFLFFGSIEPKKNIGRMIEGYLASGVETPLAIVGARAWKSKLELRLLQSEDGRPQIAPHAAARIVRLEYASYPLLVSLIRGAKAVLFPSLYEGFGLPILESMLLGTPVLSSNTSSVPEVAGDAGLLVDPYDTRAIADGVRALDDDDALRADLSDRGRRRAALFGEAAYRKRLSAVYEKALLSDGG